MRGVVNIFSSFIRYFGGLEVCKPFLGVVRQLGEVRISRFDPYAAQNKKDLQVNP